ncbi:MAG: hypothetical protein A2984_01250 [Omnitrophica WOR_2 bacterium RIFCSPLOWO2_01_FULL_41_12]|nr:MAG: hypothetical protein A2984_01250 [Omnitrophica WOR_2 bacterium RIFCSPLOWO2_01_FULL_41_12]
MYLKKLELIGFKSFLDKTILHFEPGITAVVGPNGCGKSNIFDSMRWVLGEQSVKALRGSEMQDVIFNGTDIKEPLSMAEVSLTFDNSHKFFNVPQDEVTVTRRIFRSSESEYLLNKTQVRLKDILDLMMGTGIGAESYSLVEQGKIDLVLSSRPEERRLVFDEASGITKYKAQKKEALRKLEETEQNLLRVNDIITEVKRQIGHLERQANKARRYKEVFEELKSKEINLSSLQKTLLEKEKNEIIDNLSQLQSKEAGLLSIIAEQEAKISGRKEEIETLEDNILQIKNEILNLDNLAIRNKEHIGLNEERLKELEGAKNYLQAQMEQAKNRLVLDEEKLGKIQNEYNGINKNIQDKSESLKVKEAELSNLSQAIKSSLENIAQAKRKILDLVAQIAHSRNEFNDAQAKQQISAARKRRLELEKAKVKEEKAQSENYLNSIAQELSALEKDFQDLDLKITNLKSELDNEGLSLNALNADLQNLAARSLTLESQKEFIEKLKTRYEGIDESMNATIFLDKLPKEKLTGLVVKIKSIDEKSQKLSGEAKPIELDIQKIDEKIRELRLSIADLTQKKTARQGRIQELNNSIGQLQQDLRNQELALANKKSQHQTSQEQCHKIKEEQDLVNLELEDTEKDLSIWDEQLARLKISLAELEKEQKTSEDLINSAQNNIAQNANLKERTLVLITQTRTEIEALVKRVASDEATIKIWEDTFRQDKEGLLNFETQLKENLDKKELLQIEIKDLEDKTEEAGKLAQEKEGLLKITQGKYQEISRTSSDVIQSLELEKKELDAMKDKLYELQMQSKDVEFKATSIRNRILQIYKIDLDTLEEQILSAGTDENNLAQDIQSLKEKLDSYGSVNLVAIEEYDELKKRYDFLIQQQNDLFLGKESLHEAILKINRTTKKMFLDTFERIRAEFRNYFKLLFNGGDAQLFLIDEQDPLESGIEIICRPPGKKLQNVLLLSGGEKALSAIALIFAIFKVKPSPFCVLDEIDAALDEANVDRFGRLLQEFAKGSQFIVITHNKRTINNADVMYGITMQESGVSKIVSVKFAKEELPENNKEPLVAEPV